jgi:hypothetical protein
MLINRALGFSRRGALNGLQILPPALVMPARLALQAQGIDGRMITDSGDVDPQALVAMAWDTVEVKTSVSPPVVVDLRRSGDGQASALVRELQPVVTLNGRAGRVVIAPAGEPSGLKNLQPAAVQAGLGIGLGLLGLLIVGKSLL